MTNCYETSAPNALQPNPPANWPIGTVQRLGILSGWALLIMFGLAFVLTKTLPPPGPNDAAGLTDYFRSDAEMKTLGAILYVIAGTMFIPYGAAVSARLELIRMDGIGILSKVQMSSAAAAAILMMAFGPFLMVGFLLPDLSLESYQLLNALTWMAWAGLWQPGAVQATAVAIAVLGDKSEEPVFPRWVGWFSAWMAFGSLTGFFIPFFMDGPFAWDGFISFFIAGSIYFSWLSTMLFQLHHVNSRARTAKDAHKAAGGNQVADRDMREAVA